MAAIPIFLLLNVAVKNSLGKIKVLLAEDNEVNKLLAKSILQYWGFEFKIAHTGIEVLDMLNAEDFDVILMDIQMPEKSGIEAAQDIRNLANETKRNIPIIALTANALRGEELKYKAAGMNEYLTKPFKEKELYQVIERVLNKNARFGGRFATEEEGTTAKPLYSMALVREIAHGDEGFVKNLANIFITTIPDTARQMLQACNDNQLEQAAKLAHKLKSTIDTMQVVLLKEDIRTIENNAKNGVPANSLVPLAQKTVAVLDEIALALREEFSIN